MKDVDHNTAVRRIVRTLKGPVAAVYRKLIPQLADMDGEEFYELILSRSDMLHGCVSIFHKHRDAFDHLVRDAEGRVVRDDFVQLKCGRSIHDIVSMILRTHAKKQFRSQLGGDPADPRSASGRMYGAIKEYLIHDWQIPLVPRYAELPVDMVERMGPTLLDFTTEDQLRSLTQPQAPHTAKPSGPGIPANSDHHSRDEEYWWETLNDAQVREILSPMGDIERRELTAAFCSVSEASRTALLARFSLSLPQAAVVLGVCYRSMGRSLFAQTLGPNGKPDAAEQLAERLVQGGLSSRQALKGMARVVEKAVTSPHGTISRVA